MNSARLETPRLEKLEKIRFLADEMAKRKIQFTQEINEEIKEEELFRKLMIAQSTKHKSQIFINRNKKQMLNYFALNSGSEDIIKIRNILDKKDIKGKRRQSTMPTNKKYVLKNNKINKVFTQQLSARNKINQNKNIKKDNKEENNADKNSDSFDTFNDILNDNEDENEEEKEEENSKLNSENNDSNNVIKKDNQKYEIKYVNPREFKIIYDKENSPLYNKENCISLINKKNKDKKRNFYDKEMKFLKLKNNKIEKKRKNIEKKNKDLFQVSYYLNLNSMKKVYNNPDYLPIQYKAIEEYQHHLAKIAFYQNKKKIKQLKEEKKERDEIFNYKKLKKRNFSQSSWEEFVDKVYFWQEEKRKATELKRDIINNQKKYKPKINKKSIIIIKKINKKTNNNNINNNDNIFYRLYNDQEKYDNKIKIKREQSMPSFRPIINKKSKNKIIFKGFNNIDNNIDYINKANTSIKTMQKSPSTKNNPLNLAHQNKYSIKIINNNSKKISLKNKKKTPFSGISCYNNHKISPLTMQNKNKKISYNINFEFNLFNEKKTNSNKSKNKPKVLNKQKEKNTFLSTQIEDNKQENISSEIERKKENKNNINERIDFKNNNYKRDEKYEELNKAIKNINYNKNNQKNNDSNKLLYNLNIRDNTSNTVRQNIVLISNNYKDFFYIQN